MQSKIDLRIDAKIKQTLIERAKEQNIKVSELVRQILADYCNCPTNEVKLSDNVPQKQSLSDKPKEVKKSESKPVEQPKQAKEPKSYKEALKQFESGLIDRRTLQSYKLIFGA